jgi:replicative superfamily II helicase
LGFISLDAANIIDNICIKGVSMTDRRKLEIKNKLYALNIVINDAIIDFDQYKESFRLETPLCQVLESIKFVEEVLDGKHDDFIPEEYKERMQQRVIKELTNTTINNGWEDTENEVLEMTDKELFEEYSSHTYYDDGDEISIIISDILASKELMRAVNE